MPDQKILLITGGSGYLGRHLTATAEKDFTVHTTYHASSAQVIAGIPHKLDITDEVAVAKLIERLTPDAVIHTAAANPGSPKAVMTAVNRDGSRNIAAAAAKLGTRLVHVSTDAVHSGNNAPYADDAPPSPVNPYGQSKAAAEAAVIQLAPNAAIVRTSLIYGLQEIDRGTAGFAQRLQRGESLALFHDVIRQPVWVNTLVEALLSETQIPFFRLLYLSPGKELIRNLDIFSDGRVVPYFDIPLQHVSRKILRLMRRDGDYDTYLNITTRIRKEIPDAILRTTFIVGFPGETDEDFSLLLDFIREIRFNHVGVFVYSPQDHTDAAELPNRVDEKTAADRMHKVLSIQKDISREILSEERGKTLTSIAVFLGISCKELDLSPLSPKPGSHLCKAAD
jgi:dTDP-4-dehydrorhamnose reductase